MLTTVSAHLGPWTKGGIKKNPKNLQILSPVETWKKNNLYCNVKVDFSNLTFYFRGYLYLKYVFISVCTLQNITVFMFTYYYWSNRPFSMNQVKKCVYNLLILISSIILWLILQLFTVVLFTKTACDTSYLAVALTEYLHFVGKIFMVSIYD